MPSALLEASTFEFICGMVREHSGIVLEKGKEYLVEARLQSLMRQENFASVQELGRKLRSRPFEELHAKVVDAMTTNETLFFRDMRPFDALRQHILPALVERNSCSRTVTVWCAACSSGQEPYSVAMVMKEFLEAHPGWRSRILASDISASMIERATRGSYSQLEINRGLPAQMLVKYFEQRGAEWKVDSGIRSMVEFFRMNLVNAWPPLPPMDIIFLRNVLIYFDTETKKSTLSRMRSLLKPHGYLFLGGAETTLYLDSEFDQLSFHKTVCYRPKQAVEIASSTEIPA
jgi:chemotaxis protein methyltransferase CheR